MSTERRGSVPGIAWLFFSAVLWGSLCPDVDARSAQDTQIPPAVSEVFKDSARKLVRQALEKSRAPGIVVAVVDGQRSLWSEGFGLADIENEVLAGPHMVHRIASISKPMTAVAAMQMLDAGRLDIDEDIRKYVPEFPEKRWPISARQLLGHTSGVRHYQGLDSSSSSHYSSLVKALERFAESPLLFEPGTQYRYTTYGYVLLGLVVERVSGRDLEEYLRAQVWEPAGMTATRFERQGQLVPHRARGYSLVNGEIRNAPFSDLSFKYPGGGVISTAEDLLRFLQAFEAGRLVSDEARDLMLTQVELPGGKMTGYGLGWKLSRTESGGRIYGHTGGQTGTTTAFGMLHGQGRATAVISNLRKARGVTGLQRQLLALLRD